MDRSTQPDANDDSTETQTMKDLYGEIDPSEVETREDYDPALLPEGLVPEESPDGRDYHTAAWDGGVSDLEAADGPYSTEQGAPAVLVYVSNQGGVQVHEGELRRCDGRVVTVEADDGTTRTARDVDMDTRRNAVESDSGRYIGKMCEVRLVESWDDYERRMELLADAREDDSDDDQDDDGDDSPDVRTDGGREQDPAALTPENLEVTARTQHPTETKHAFEEGDRTALCGHKSTRHLARDQGATWRDVECRNCKRALADRYVSESDAWEATRDLEENDVVRVSLQHGEDVEAVVTSPADDLDMDHHGNLYVSLTVDTGTPGYLRGPKQDYKLTCSEECDPVISYQDLTEELDENPLRPVEAVEVVGKHDPLADDDPETRENLMYDAGRLAANHERMAARTQSREEYLFNVNFARGYREVAARLREGRPLSWVRQKVEQKVENLDGHGDETYQDDDATREDGAKASGHERGYKAALKLLRDRLGDDSDDSDGDDDQDDACPNCGGEGECVGSPSEHAGGVNSAPSYVLECQDCGTRYDDFGHVVADGREVEHVGPHTRVVYSGNGLATLQVEESDDVGTRWEAVEELHGEFCTDCREFFDHAVPVNTGHATNGESGCPKCHSAESLRSVVREHGDERTITNGYIPEPSRDDALVLADALQIMRGDDSGDEPDVRTDGGHERTTPEADGLVAGDSLALPNGKRLVVVGRADDAPPAGASPLYEAEIRDVDGNAETHLYGPHNVRQALEGGAQYAGSVPVEEEREPFWCAGCEYPHRDEERHHALLLDDNVCSYGCAERVQKNRLRERLSESG